MHHPFSQLPMTHTSATGQLPHLQVQAELCCQLTHPRTPSGILGMEAGMETTVVENQRRRTWVAPVVAVLGLACLAAVLVAPHDR